MSSQQYSKVAVPKINRNVFNLTHDVKSSMQFGNLCPMCCIEVLPGDKFKIGADLLAKFAPLIAPTMHGFSMFMHYFFVPNRIIWPNWERFITQDITATEFAPPYIQIDEVGFGYTKLCNYFGIPSPTLNSWARGEMISALPFAAYLKIYNEYYRDQNLIPYVGIGVTDDVQLQDGDNSAEILKLTELRVRSYEHDYFTSCLPFSQKGASVNIPINMGDVRVAFNGEFPESGNYTADDGTLVNVPRETPTNPANWPWLDDTLFAKTSDNTYNAEINDLRKAIVLQQFLELSARGGTRYTEMNKAHWNVQSPDSRLQRPEYITGVRSDFMITETLATASSEDMPQSNMSGNGVSYTSGKFGSYYATEHGFIIGICSVLPKTAYYQGIARMWSRLKSPIDYPWPSFAHLGEQEVLNREIFAGTNLGDDTFGYLPRYAEMKDIPNRISGDMVSSLKFWNDARKFGSMPVLNQEFIECPPDATDHPIFAVTTPGLDYVYMQVLNKISVLRALPKFGVPKLI